MTNVVTEGLSDAEIDRMESVAIDSFDVSGEAVNAEVSYIASGSMQLSIPEDTAEQEVVDAITSTLAELLGVHPRDVVVTSVDLETGEVEYDVASDNFVETSDIQSNIDSLSIDDIENSIQQTIPEIEVESSSVGDDIEVDVTIVVDGSDASNIREARTGVEDVLTNLGYDVT